MKVLSLFDGISCARVALKEAGIEVEQYYASEIDKYAIQVSKKRWPTIRHIGDVRKVAEQFTYAKDGHIDLLIGGSPCQDLSIAKKNRKGLDGERSGLFWEYINILRKLKPKYFILENVASMPKEDRDVITRELGVEPIMIDAGLVSAQTRRRLFWTNIEGVKQPKDRGLYLRDILEEDGIDITEQVKKKIKGTLSYQKTYGNMRTIDEKAKTLTASGQNISNTGATNIFIHDEKLFLAVREATKKGYAIAKDGDSVDLSFPNSKTRRGRVGEKAKNLMTSSSISVFKGGMVRKLTPKECERLQGLPDGYTKYGDDGGWSKVDISNAQRYKMLGNAFHVDVIAHILKHI